jgi:RNA polymerase sigma-70 factor, ECF subfamily
MRGQLQNKIGKPGVAVVLSSNATVDEELVLASKSGDGQAFETLVNRHQRRILALAFRYTRVREDAEDVVQETFQKAFVHLQKFEGTSSFSTWATRVAINQALMLLRRRRGQHEVSIDDSSSNEGTTPMIEAVDASPDPEASCMHKEEAQILSAAMARLRPGMRRALELKELGALSARETAGHMDVSVGAIKARVFQARKRLGKELRQQMRLRRMCSRDILAISGNGPVARKIA